MPPRRANPNQNNNNNVTPEMQQLMTAQAQLMQMMTTFMQNQNQNNNNNNKNNPPGFDMLTRVLRPRPAKLNLQLSVAYVPTYQSLCDKAAILENKMKQVESRKRKHSFDKHRSGSSPKRSHHDDSGSSGPHKHGKHNNHHNHNLHHDNCWEYALEEIMYDEISHCIHKDIK